MSLLLFLSWTNLPFGRIQGEIVWKYSFGDNMDGVVDIHYTFTSTCSEFQDIFDVDHFITSLRDEIRILKQLPPKLKKRVESGKTHSMAPISWSDISYYRLQVSFPYVSAISILKSDHAFLGGGMGVLKSSLAIFFFSMS